MDYATKIIKNPTDLRYDPISWGGNCFMRRQHNEIKMIWLMVLIIVAISSWLIDIPSLAFLCVAALVISVMQYVSAIDEPAHQLEIAAKQDLKRTSRLPLYVASLVALIGGFLNLTWLVGLGLTVWIYFLLNWLRDLEKRLIQLNTLQSHLNSQLHHSDTLNETKSIEVLDNKSSQTSLDFQTQIQTWLFQGNPVLKVAIVVLVIGVILLLRYAVEHWMLDLSIKLLLVAFCALVVIFAGYLFRFKNYGFALALQALGASGLFLTILFSYHYLVLDFSYALLSYILSLCIVVGLSLKQRAVELSVMAMIIAYIAPFTLPQSDFSSIQLISYYLLINVAVGLMSSINPWKILNQIALIITIGLGAGFVLINGYASDRFLLACLVLAHAAIFIWLGFRFNQRQKLAEKDGFDLIPIVDTAFIFISPLVAYAFIYLMYFESVSVQIGLCLALAGLYYCLYRLAQYSSLSDLVTRSYLSLIFIFLSFIPPILLPQEWSVVGWALEALVILVWALHRLTSTARKLSYGLLVVAGFSYLYYLVELNYISITVTGLLLLSYLLAIYISNMNKNNQTQLTWSDKALLSFFAFIASILMISFGIDLFDRPNELVLTLLMGSILYFVMNILICRASSNWSWLLPKWMALIPMMCLASIIVGDQLKNGQIVWGSFFQQAALISSCLIMAWIWLIPRANSHTENEWTSFFGLISIALASIALIPHMPFLSVVILPSMLLIYSYLFEKKYIIRMIWTSKSGLLLLSIWMISSQLITHYAFIAYVFPIFNPFDLLTLGMLFGYLWMLNLQKKLGMEKSLIALLMLLGILWVSSYVLLRALNVYLGTPYNDITLWQDSTVQLSLTLLWVTIAFVVMLFATRKKHHSMWLFGASILGIVTLKLVLLDLSHIGTLNRVLSFLGAGLIMLIIAYIAPVPKS